MYRILYFILILGMLICSSCSKKSEQDKKLETELRQFKAKAITFPDNMEAKVCDGKISPDTTLLSRPYKMVIYVGKVEISEMALANVEALANGESGGKTCYTYCCQTKYNTCLDALRAEGCTSMNITLNTGC